MLSRRRAPARAGAAARSARRARPSSRTPATPPFLKSTRAPVRSWTTCDEVGVVADDEDARRRRRRRAAASSASRDVEAVGQRRRVDRLDAERLAGQQRGVARAHLRARVAPPRTSSAERRERARPPRATASSPRVGQRAARRRGARRAARPRRAAGATAGAPWRGPLSTRGARCGAGRRAVRTLAVGRRSTSGATRARRAARRRVDVK